MSRVFAAFRRISCCFLPLPHHKSHTTARNNTVGEPFFIFITVNHVLYCSVLLYYNYIIIIQSRISNGCVSFRKLQYLLPTPTLLHCLGNGEVEIWNKSSSDKRHLRVVVEQMHTILGTDGCTCATHHGQSFIQRYDWLPDDLFFWDVIFLLPYTYLPITYSTDRLPLSLLPLASFCVSCYCVDYHRHHGGTRTTRTTTTR